MRLARAIACAMTVALAQPVLAEDDAALALRASSMISEAAERLAAADTARDRIAALTETVRAFETGLAALRAGLRQTALRQRELQDRLGGQDDEIGTLLTMLQSVSRETTTGPLLHPGSATDSLRAGMLSAALVPALQDRANALEADLRALEDVASIQERGLRTLEDALTGIRAARLELSAAISERTDLPAPLATDAAAIEALINSADTLAAFADSLGSGDGSDALAETWLMPVLGDVTRDFGEVDAAGIARPGWIISTPPMALVTAPVQSTVRYAGDVPDHGKVVILEPAADTLVILAGLGETMAVRDQIVSPGDPIGLMGGRESAARENLIESGADGGQFPLETLYMEVRQAEAAINPTRFLTQTGNKDRE